MSYRSRGPTITRQLTEDEEALEGRVSSFINSTQGDVIGHSQQQRYAWMEQDLKMRAMQGAALKQESDLATDIGDKRELARQDTFATEEEAAAMQGLEEIDRLVADEGMDYDEATIKVSAKRKLGLNAPFAQEAANRSRLWKSPEQREYEKNKQRADALKLESETFNHEEALKLIKEDPEGYRKTLRDTMEAGKISAAASLTAARAAALDNDYKLAEAERKAELAKTIGDASPDSLADLSYVFQENNLGGVTSPEKVIKMFEGETSKGILTALLDSDFMKQSFPGDDAAMEAIGTSLNVLTGDVPDATEADRKQAMSNIFTYAGKHKAYYQGVIKNRAERQLKLEEAKALEAANKPLADSYKSALSSIDQIVSKSEGREKNAALEVAAVASAGQEFIGKLRALSPTGKDPIFDEYEKYFEDAKSMSNTKEAATQVKARLSNFIKSYKGAQGGSQKTIPNDILQKIAKAKKESGGNKEKFAENLKSMGINPDEL